MLPSIEMGLFTGKTSKQLINELGYRKYSFHINYLLYCKNFYTLLRELLCNYILFVHNINIVLSLIMIFINIMVLHMFFYNALF